MSIIKQLPPEIYNMISAGEVVDRPASAIKELVENSIDAGASRINISIENGGVDYIEISDNGCGIDEDDVVVAFRPHSTSKLDNADQLFSISTLGFRGEALASIAAVADVTVTTKTPFDEIAVCVAFKNGVAVDKSKVSYNTGTKIVVENLFENVPARRKFLKSNSREGTLVTKYINSLILTNPFVEINYKVDGQYVYQFKGTGLEEAIHCLYGNKCLSNCLPINSTYNGITVKGYVGNPQFTKGNSTYQTLSVNGRYIKNDTVAAAVKQAFMPFLVSRSYPFYVLDIAIDLSEVDVNVHPNKLEVRFADTRKIFVAVSYPIKDALQRHSEHRVQRLIEGNENTQMEFRLHTTQAVATNTSDVFVPYDDKVANERNFQTGVAEFRGYDDKILNENSMRQQSVILEHMSKLTLQSVLDSEQSGVALFPHAPDLVLDYDNFDIPASDTIRRENYEKIDFGQVTILGTLFNTYFLLEMQGQLVMIDQHAAHERILYDKYMASCADLPMQPMLVPFVVTVSPQEFAFIEDNLDTIAKAGFELQPFGSNTFRVVAVASIFVDCKFDKLFKNILQSVDLDYMDSNKLLSERIAMIACKHAVKAGDKLSDLQIKTILEQLYENRHLQCPHGRPISVEMTQKEIEKMFKRIV